jgi:hypothetical protein
MNVASSIVGTWKIPSSMVEDADEFMHVGDDGRIVHFVHTDSSGNRIIPMKFWLEYLGEDRYWIRPRPRHEGWSIRMFPTESGMRVDRSEMQFDFVAASDAELPDWYHQRLADELSRMDSREREATEAQQVGSSNGG